jgi:uncharacterized nucleotidyltransferase DUF6036
MTPFEVVTAFDRFLAGRALRREAVVIGGAALNLLGLMSRPTKDCDILHPELPVAIAEAARAFVVEMRAAGEVLQDDWLNNGPATLAHVVPDGWMTRLQPVFSGTALELSTLGRGDLLRSKIFALCDRGIDLGDCIALAPSADELRELAPWLEAQDGNPDWPEHVRGTVADLARRLGHGL